MTPHKNKEKEHKHKKKKTAKKPESRAGKNMKGTKKRRQKKVQSLRRRFLAVAALLAGVALAAFLIWYSGFDRINLEDYVAVTYTGYDTKGTAHLSLQPSARYGAFLDDLRVELLSDNGSLQNGDVLSVYFVYDKEFAKEQKLRIKSDSCQIIVDKLPEGKPLSPEQVFENLKVSFEGTAPELSVLLTNESTDPFLRTISYEIQNPKDFYDAEDSFTVKAVFSETAAIKNQYVTEAAGSYIRRYSTGSRDRFIRDAGELSPEAIEALNKTAAGLMDDANEYGLRIFSEANLMPIWINGKTTFKWSNPRLLSAYLNVLKPEYFESSKSHNNDVRLVYLATLSQSDGVACDAEVVVQFNNLLQKADGSLDLSLDSGRIIAASFKDSHIKDLVFASYDKQYESEKIPL